MSEAWAPLTFKHEAGIDVSREREPVAPTKRTGAALEEVHTRTLPDCKQAIWASGNCSHLATMVRNIMRPKSAKPGEATFTLTTRPTPKQQQALDLLAAITVQPVSHSPLRSRSIEA